MNPPYAGCYPQLASKAFLIQLASATYQCRNRAPSCISFRRIATMLIGVLITPGAPGETIVQTPGINTPDGRPPDKKPDPKSDPDSNK